jgi:RNA polymerase-binding transcription factor DksA
MARATKAKASAKKTPSKSAATSSRSPAKGAASGSKAEASKATAKKASTKKAPTKKAGSKKATTKKASPKKAAATSKAAAKKAPAAQQSRAGDEKFLAAQLKALEGERVTYTRQAATLRAEADSLVAEREPGDVQFDDESGEGDTIAVERERDLALSAQATAAIEEIDTAIAKIHDGTYGVCDRCGKDIPKERLRALPHAALCVTCKSAGFSRR